MTGKIRMGMVLFPLFLIFVAAAAANAATAQAAKDQSFIPRWWERAQVIKKLELTEDQLSRVRDLYRTHSKEIVRAREALNAERARLRQLLLQDSPDDSRVEQQIAAVGSALSALFSTEGGMHCAMLKELSGEQRKALVPILEQRREVRHKKSRTENESERKKLDKRYNRF